MRPTLCTAVVLLTAVAAPADVLTTLDKERFEGDLVRVAGGQVVIKTKDGEVTRPVDRVLAVQLAAGDAAPTAKEYTAVALNDGSLLRCKFYTVQGTNLVLEPADGSDLAAVSVPLRAVDYTLRGAEDAAVKRRFDALRRRKTNRDRIVLGRTRLNALEGTVEGGEAGGKILKFTLSSGRSMRPPVPRLTGIIFGQAPAGEVAPTLCRVTDKAGNRLNAKSMTLGGEGLSLVTVSGAAVKYPKRDALTRLDFSPGKLAYLSAMKPLKVDAEPAMDFFGDRYRRDKSLDLAAPGPLRLGRETFERGLAVHAGTRLTYDIGGDFDQFEAVIGVDNSARTDSRVSVTFEGDGRVLFRAQVKTADDPRPVTLRVKDVRILRVTVESLKEIDLGDQVNIAKARLTK